MVIIERDIKGRIKKVSQNRENNLQWIGNFKNNNPDNLNWICKGCHNKVHIRNPTGICNCVKDEKGRFARREK